MASNNLRIILNINKSVLFRKCTLGIVTQRFTPTRTLVNFNKIRINNVNNISLMQKRFQTTINQTPKPTPTPGNINEKVKSGSIFKNLTKIFVAFVSGVFAYYGISMYLDFYEDKADTSPKAIQYKPGVIKNFSKKIDRGVENPGNIKITLYQYATCPFCCKVRAYLDYYGYNYDIVEVNSIFRQQLKWSAYRKVPIVAVQEPVSCDLKTKEMIYDDKFIQLNDSSVIISTLETYRLNPSVSIKEIASYYEPIESKDSRGKQVYDYPNKYFLMLQDRRFNSVQALNNLKDEREWRTWVDSKFVHVISPNVYRTLKESIDAFKWFDKAGNWENNFNTFERYCAQYIGALAMYFVGKKLKEKYELKDDVRQSMYDYANEWVEAVGTTNKFRGGATPNLGDLALYGVLRSFKGCLAFHDLMRHVKIKEWYENCNKHVKLSKGKDKLNLYALSFKQVEQQKPLLNEDVKPAKKRFYFF